MNDSTMKVPRRVLRNFRSLTRLGLVAIGIFSVLVFLDSRFRVLPQSIHDHLPSHHDGLIITDVTIKTCSALNPFSSCRLDPTQWHRIDKDLYLGGRWGQAYVHVQRKTEEELESTDSVLLDLRISRLNPSPKTKEWEPRPNGLWIKRSHKRHDSDNKMAVTAVDVLFGPDSAEPRPGWTKGEVPVVLDDAGEGIEAHLTVRRGKHLKPVHQQPRIKRNGHFKIMQLADLHLATGLGVCRDAEPAGSRCDADQRTLDFVRRLLDDEEPDLVVLSGDQVNGDTAPDATSAIFKMVDQLIKRTPPIPYAAIFGNHDDEKTMSRAAQMSIMEDLPFSLSRAGPDHVSGVGNYYVEVLAPGTSQHSALTLWFLDTHAYSPEEKKYPGYDWLKEDQIKWFKDTSRSLKPAHHKYTKIHMDMAFIHIPLPEYRDTNNIIVGDWLEGVTAPNFNTGFKDALVEEGVLAVSCGHDHANSYCALDTSPKGDPQLWMCYGGGAGFGGYGGYGGYHRRIRLFDVNVNEGRISTWKRLEYGHIDKRIDEQIIVDAGKAVEP